MSASSLLTRCAADLFRFKPTTYGHDFKWEKEHGSDRGDDSAYDEKDEELASLVVPCIPENVPVFGYIHFNQYTNAHDGHSLVEEECMQCECRPTDPCGEHSECINRLLLVECMENCPAGHQCQNKRFQRRSYADICVLETPGKGFGLVCKEDIYSGQFIMEYVGEVLNHTSFLKRSKKYAEQGSSHFYFMTLSSSEVIDASTKGNLSRFMNHSCNPNCETQKWIVNKRMRIGIFATKYIPRGTELTFDYKFEWFGEEPQLCHCSEPNCKGTIGSQRKVDYDDTEQDVVDPDTGKRNASSRLFSSTKNKKQVSGLEKPEEVPLIVKTILQTENVDLLLRQLKILQMTSNENCLKRFVQLHGLQIIHSLISLYRNEPTVLYYVVNLLNRLPFTTRNAIEDSKIEPRIKRLLEHEDITISRLAASILNQWSSLELVYKIPKASSTSLFCSLSNKDEASSDTSVSNSLFSQDPQELKQVVSIVNSWDTSNGKHEIMDIFSALKRVPETFKKTRFDAVSRNTLLVEHDQGPPPVRSSSKSLSISTASENGSASPQLADNPLLDELGHPLPPNWRRALDADKRTYYYNMISFFTQWDVPKKDPIPISLIQSPSAIISAPGIDANALQKVLDQALASNMTDMTSTLLSTGEKKERMAKLKDQISEVVIQCMSKFKHQIPTDEFKHLARKLTHYLVDKEASRSNDNHGSLSDYIDKTSKKKMKLYIKTFLLKLGYKKPDKLKSKET